MKRLACIVVLGFFCGCQFPTEFVRTMKESIKEDRDFKETVATTFTRMGNNALTSGDILKGLGLSGIGILLGGGSSHYIRRNGKGLPNG